ncbi:MAG: hypothetical protein R2762_10040 [Bryobacteraceae bacterium]
MDWNSIGTAAREAFRTAVNEWIAQAQLRGGRITGPAAEFGPGSLWSPVNLEVKLLQSLTAAKLSSEVAQALAKILASAWNDWAGGFQLRSQSAFPTFVAVPASHAPPTPAAPIPLQSSVSSGEPSLSSALLNAKLTQALRAHAVRSPGNFDLAAKQLADWVDSSFQEWKRIVMISGVVGQGPVPTFAPPYVPVGPVVMGSTIPNHTSLFAGPRFGKIVL